MMLTMKVTFDTNILPADDLLAACSNHSFDFAVVSVTERELDGTDLLVELKPLGKVIETGVYGESKYRKARYGSKQTHFTREEILSIISGGSFPPDRQCLSKGHRRQLRDSMIFHAHVREQRDIFVTNDCRGFIRDGRREKLQEGYNTQIMTRNEFEDFIKIGLSQM